MMNKELLHEAESLWKRREKASRFSSRFNVYPMKEGLALVDNLYRLGDSISDEIGPSSEETVLERELRRRLTGEALALDHSLSGRYYTFNDVVNLLGIPEEDLTGLRSWLEVHKPETEAAIQGAYEKTEVEGYELSLPLDRAGVSSQAEGLCNTYLTNYHEKLGSLFKQLTDVGEFLRDIRSVPTTNPRSYFDNQRSYFDNQTNTLAIGIPDICYMAEDRTLHIKERRLINLFGHEGMGHGLNFVITQASDLPFFLKESSWATTASLESVAQYFERVIFDDLRRSPKTQKDLGISREFDEIYEEEKETQLINEYQLRFFQYAITVLADTKLGNPQDPETIRRKIELLTQLALYPAHAVSIVENNKDHFDSQGNLDPSLVSELRYCAQPARRAISIFQDNGIEYQGENRSSIDNALLRGFWTPIGLVENARIVAAN